MDNQQNQNLLYTTIKEIVQFNDTKLLENFFKENHVTPHNFNNFNDILIFSIKANVSVENIQFIIHQRHHPKTLNFFNNKNETPLLVALAQNRFDIADTLIFYEADINYMANNYETIDFLFKNNQLNPKNLKYALHHGLNEKNITSSFIEKLIVTKNNEFLEILFVYYNKFNTYFIDRFLLLYKNKIPLSKKELEWMMPKEKNRLTITEEMYKIAYNSRNWEAFRILFENDGSEDCIRWERIINYHVLENAIKSNDPRFVRKVLRYAVNLSERASPFPEKIMNGNSKDAPENENTINLCHVIFCHNRNEKTNQETYPFLEAIKQNNLEIVQLLVDYATTYSIPININDRDYWWGNYPLLEAIKQNNVDIVALLVKYDYQNMKNIHSGTIELKNYPLLEAIKHNSLEIVKRLMEYADHHEIIININESNALRQTPLANAIQHHNLSLVKLLLDYSSNHAITINLEDLCRTSVKQNNIEMVNLFMDYANDHNTKIRINDLEEWENSSTFMEAICQNNHRMVKLLMTYAKNHDIPISINEKNSFENFPLLEAIHHNNLDMVEILINYAEEQKIILDLNKKNYQKNYSVMKAIKRNNPNILNLILKYAERHHILLKINDRYHDEELDKENYPLLEIVTQNNIEEAKAILDYANNHNITLMLKKKGELFSDPLLIAIEHNYTSMTKLLLDYSREHNIDICMDRYPWESPYNPYFNAIPKNNNIKIMKVLTDYMMNKNNIMVKEEVNRLYDE
ncbi:hypothetical protein PIROE2DRAFT_5350 [Piromyces sp. E2]|nr:hypothetical protein PIROE2DRAFT_5350 [Piromyces sp. E2]|eukprot:OUM67286.1 hypothetical protein PIROE2DRAFT_5350 [Piromyces sp. E2]